MPRTTGWPRAARWPTSPIRTAAAAPGAGIHGVQVLSAAALAAVRAGPGVQTTWSAWVFAMAPIFLLAAAARRRGGWRARPPPCWRWRPFRWMPPAPGCGPQCMACMDWGLAQGGAGVRPGATRGTKSVASHHGQRWHCSPRPRGPAATAATSKTSLMVKVAPTLVPKAPPAIYFIVKETP